jgi:pyruvate dehydrogenase E2 component (dihydrolipoamide acetyltransferase)
VASDTASGRGETRIEEPTAAERTIARRTAEARATIPDIELCAEVDMEPSLALADLERYSLTAMLVRACALALREVPRANGAYRDGHFELYSRVNIGVVVAGEEAYLIPTVFDADLKSLRELSQELEQLTARAYSRELSPPALSGATFTLWNAGALGITRSGIVINPPQVAALAAGSVRAVPTLRDGTLRMSRSMSITLACDHRMLYGARAGGFLAKVKSVLETELSQ